MIRLTTEDGVPTCVAELGNRVAVYLDNDSLIHLARDGTGLQPRFVSAIRHRGSLLFSFTNAIEVSGPQGDTAAAVWSFLDAIGSCWLPLALSPWEVADRESAGAGPQSAVSENFIRAYFQERAYELSPEGSLVLNLSADSFFRLSAVVNWAQQDRAGIQQRSAAIDEALRDRIRNEQRAYEADPAALDVSLPPVAFDPLRPGTFALIHLLRILVREARAYQFAPHDGLDLCHAVLGAAYARIATLDRQWKRRIGQIPGPNQLAEVYYRPEVADLVARLEALVAG